MMTLSKKRQPERVALITGGAQGIGRAISERLAADGYSVAVIDIARASDVVGAIRDAGGRAEAFVCDVTSPDAVAAATQQVESSLGPVDIVVANAGRGPVMPFLELSFEIWREVMDLNVDGVFHTIRASLPGMVERRWGRVIVITSGIFYTPIPNFSAYIASKGAVIGLVRGLAQEVGAYGVTVNCIAPSLTPTRLAESGPQREMGLFDKLLEQQAIKRLATPEDIGKAASFLVSDDGDFVTAQVLASDGGAINV